VQFPVGAGQYAIEEAFANEPVGSRGAMSYKLKDMQWGHAINVEKTTSGFKYFDPQAHVYRDLHPDDSMVQYARVMVYRN